MLKELIGIFVVLAERTSMVTECNKEEVEAVTSGEVFC